MYGRSHVLHDISNGECLSFEPNLLSGGGGSSRGVDVHCDGVSCGLVVKVEEFCDNEFGNCGYERHTDVYDTVVKEEGWEIRRRSDAYS